MNTRQAAVPQYVAFAQGRRIAQGSEAEVLSKLALAVEPTLVFDALSGEQVELPTVAARPAAETSEPTGRPGRPKLGVVAREVTLLPHDWDWLNQQPGGASVTLRKLVLKARRASADADGIRQAQVVCYRFISAIAGNEAGFEEASRALFSGDARRFEQHTQAWPQDVRDHARQLAKAAFAAAATAA